MVMAMAMAMGMVMVMVMMMMMTTTMTTTTMTMMLMAIVIIITMNHGGVTIQYVWKFGCFDDNCWWQHFTFRSDECNKTGWLHGGRNRDSSYQNEGPLWTIPYRYHTTHQNGSNWRCFKMLAKQVLAIEGRVQSLHNIGASKKTTSAPRSKCTRRLWCCSAEPFHQDRKQI